MSKPNEKKRDFFWLSYSDLMTSLFFVMLVLFVLVYSMQNKLISDLERTKEKLERTKEELEVFRECCNDSLRIAKEELDRIKEIQKTVDNIDAKYFKYDSINKKHILNMSFEFPNQSYDITKIKPDKRDGLLEAGKAIKALIERYPKEENIKYLVVVEGQASKDGWRGNNDLSYHRAQSLVNFWKAKKVGLDALGNCEIIIAGSGEGGLPREEPDNSSKNQRFLITIVPKIGEMKK